ncbi:hypothetical protein [Actinomyces sp.]|uniref:hypothetical protein n=1 Tax=Actinomyces sp. TaxID=29317 RepID=UPI002897C38D|nr:hypothetical protein [Actinomyces sp.]
MSDVVAFRVEIVSDWQNQRMDPYGASSRSPVSPTGWNLLPLQVDAADPQVSAVEARLRTEEPLVRDLLTRGLPQLPAKPLRSVVTVGDIGGAGVALLLGVLALGSTAMGGIPRAAVVGGLLVIAAVFLVVRALRERARAAAMEGSGPGSPLERVALYEQLRGLAAANGLAWRPISEPRHAGGLLMQPDSQALCVTTGARGASMFELGLLTGGAAGHGPHLYAVATAAPGSTLSQPTPPDALARSLPAPARTEVVGNQAAVLLDVPADPTQLQSAVPLLAQWIDAVNRGGALR